MNKIAAFILLTLVTWNSGAYAQSGQPVRQSGSITPGHATRWITTGVVGDAGTAANGSLTSVGVTASGPGICQNSGPITGAYIQVCLGVTSAGGGVISQQSLGGAASEPFTLTLDGTSYQFPFVIGGGGVIGPLTTVAGNIVTWNNTQGTLVADSGVSFANIATNYVDVAHAATPLLCNGTDQTANLAALFAAYPNGAVFLFHGCTYQFNSTIIMPNTGGGNPAAQLVTQSSYWFIGTGDTWLGYQIGSAPCASCTVFDLRGGDADGMIQTYGGNAVLGARHITFTSGINSQGNPFIKTTHTTLDLQDVAFIGSSDKGSTTANQDAVIFGGTSQDTNSNITNGAFQGYGSRIDHAFFDGIRRAAVGGTFSNGVHLSALIIWTRSGNPLYGATATASIGAGGAGYVIGDQITLAGGVINSPTVIQVTAVAGGAVTGASLIIAPGGYIAAPANPIAQSSTTGIGTGATFNMTYAQIGAAIEDIGLDAPSWYIDSDLIDMDGYFYAVRIANGNTEATVRVALDDIRQGAASIAGVHISATAGYSKINIGPGAASFLLVQDDNAVGGCASSIIMSIGGNTATDYQCMPLLRAGGLRAGGIGTLAGGVEFVGGASNPVTVQPGTAVGGGSNTFMQVLRSAAEGVSPGAVIFAWKSDGASEIGGSAAGDITNNNVNGVSYSNNGRTLTTNNAFTIDTISFIVKSAGTQKMNCVASALAGCSYGSSADANWYRNSSAAMMQSDTPIRAGASGIFSSLPSCSATYSGAIATVTDSNTTTWGATVAGTSGSTVLAFCNGTNWTVAGK